MGHCLIMFKDILHNLVAKEIIHKCTFGKLNFALLQLQMITEDEQLNICHLFFHYYWYGKQITNHD